MGSDTGVLIAVSSVLGICIGILLEYFLSRWRQWEIVQAVKQAFYTELNTFWGQLSEEVEDSWIEYEQEKEKGNQAYLNYFLKVPPDFFTIYRSNANYFGQIDDSELRAKIIKVYMLLEALMHGYRTNTEYLREYIEIRDKHEKERAKFLAVVGQNMEKYSQNFAEVQGIEALANKSLQQLTRYAVELKEAHDDFTEKIEDLLEDLRKELPKPNNYKDPTKTISNLRSSNPTT